MKAKSFGDYIWSGLTDKYGKIFSGLGIFLSVIAYFVKPTVVIPQKVVVVGLFILIAGIFVFLQTAKIIYDELTEVNLERENLKDNLDSYFGRPEVVHVKAPPSPSIYYSETFAILFTNPTGNLPYDSVVSVYFLSDGFEELIAIGKVANIQDDKKVQVILIYDQQFEKHKDKIMSNSAEALSNIIVKPTIPSFMLKGDLYVG